MERVTLERFRDDPELLNRIYARARRERDEAIGRTVVALCAGLLGLFARRDATTLREGACDRSETRGAGA